VNIKYKIKPLSVNDAFQGRRFKNTNYKTYEKELLAKLPKIEIPKPPYKIYFEFGFSNAASDWDNPIKPLQDILQKKYKFNDKDVYEATIIKKVVKKGSEYFIVKLESIQQ